MKIKVQKQDDGRLAIYVPIAGRLKIFGRNLGHKVVLYVPRGMTVAIDRELVLKDGRCLYAIYPL